MNRVASIVSALIVAATAASAPAPEQGRVVTVAPAVLEERARIGAINAMLRERLDTLLPQVMRESGIDLWVVINREYAEDPVYLTLVPEPAFNARRTTMLVFYDRGPDKEVEKLTVSRYPLGGVYEPAWQGGDVDAQWKRLAEVIRERNPKKIALDVSRDWAFADGLTHGLHQRFLSVLDPQLQSRIVSAEPLVIRWMETRTPLERETWPQIVALARSVVEEAFSEQVITPGITTVDDVSWYIHQRYVDLGLDVWFHPDVNVQRASIPCAADAPFCGDESAVIRRGDVLHCDVGITYLRLNTDTQEMGYVLKSDESDVPEGLKNALAIGNRWQDLLTKEFVAGRTGNEILAAARASAEKEGIAASVYSHPLGYFGHAPGPTIGMWDNQGPTKVHGDWKLRANTGYAIEGNVKVAVPEWGGNLVQIKLEQSALFDGQKVRYLAGRQTSWHVVK